MATSNTQPPKDDKKDALHKIKAKMQGYKQPIPESPVTPDSPEERPLNKEPKEPAATIPDAATFDQIPVDSVGEDNLAPEESTPYNKLSTGLLERFRTVTGVESERYNSRPWRQLPNETALEYALFGEYLKPPMAKGRDLEELARRLNDPALHGWYAQLLNTLSVPKYIVDGFDVKKKSNGKSNKEKDKPEVNQPAEAETRALWWLAERNHWPERGRLYDAWQLDVLAHERKLKIQEFAQEIHRNYVEHSYAMMGLLNVSREGLIRGVTHAKGQFRKQSIVKQSPPSDSDPSFTTLTEEWDPLAQLDAMNKISDRLHGPLPNMLDGKVSTVLDQTLSMPATLSANGEVQDGELNGNIPEKKHGNAPWLLQRLEKVQAAMERKKLTAAPPEQEEGGGVNEKPQGT